MLGKKTAQQKEETVVNGKGRDNYSVDGGE
jgi:hypothetical protein